MSEENRSEFQAPPPEWQAPPPPEKIEAPEPAQMSEMATILGIFFEPGKVFEDLRRKPRFIVGSLIIALLVTAYSFGLFYKVGDAGMRTFAAEQLDKNPRASGMTNEQREGAIDLQLKITSVIRYIMPVFVFIFLLLGGLFYWLGGKAFGGNGGFLNNLSVWIYSSIPPSVIGMILNFVVLGLKSADDIDIGASQRGVIHASLAAVLDSKAMPVLATIVGTVDLFFIWGWILAAIGLRITNRISSSSAWGITLIFALVGVAFRVFGAFFSGNAG